MPALARLHLLELSLCALKFSSYLKFNLTICSVVLCVAVAVFNSCSGANTHKYLFKMTKRNNHSTSSSL